MRNNRFYLDQPLCPNSSFELGADAAHHAIHVLRLKEGAPLKIFNGQGGEYEAHIESIHKKKVLIAVGAFLPIDNESHLQTHLAIGVSKGERFDWALQKATELGVTTITPLFTERTEVKLKQDRIVKKLQHWRSILVNACEQCQRNVIPILNQPITLEAFLQEDTGCELNLFLHQHGKQVLDKAAKPRSICLVVGPEGGFSDNEFDAAMKQGFETLTLGNRVLRTETAPVAALATLQFLWGDLS